MLSVDDQQITAPNRNGSPICVSLFFLSDMFHFSDQVFLSWVLYACFIADALLGSGVLRM